MPSPFTPATVPLSGLAPNSVVLSTSVGPDVHLAGAHGPLWNVAYDNSWDYGVLSAIPSALGLSNPLNGSTNLITTLAAGTWAIEFDAEFVADAAFEGVVLTGNGGLNTPSVGPGVVLPTGQTVRRVAVSEIQHLPAAATIEPTIRTTIASTANPYRPTVYCLITRLA